MPRDSESDRQLSLFGTPPPAGRRQAVGPAEVPPDLEAAAAALPREVYLGTSSWSFPGWEGLVYDRKATKTQLSRKGLAAYARHPLLRTVGVDRTFYAPIGVADFAGYAAQVPEDFRFLVKASSQCTTPYVRDSEGPTRRRNPLFLDTQYAADAVVGPFVEGLGDKAGPLIFQFPPLGATQVRQPERFADSLGEFLTALPRGPRYAVELRNGELLSPAYGDALREGGAGHCLSLHPRMPPVAEQLERVGPAAEGPLIARWMLRSGLDYRQALQRYEPFSELVDEDPANRSTLAELCVDRIVRRQPVIVVANNKAEGSAPWTVFKLAESIARKLEERR